MPDMPPPSRPPEAAIAPRPFLPDGKEPQAYFRKIFGPILGMRTGALLHVRAQGHMYFMSPDPTDSLYFAKDHPYSPAERFAWWVVASDRQMNMLAVPEAVGSWQDRPEAVKFGWLRDEQELEAPPADIQAAFRRYATQREQAWKNLLVLYQGLKAKPHPTDAERAQIADAEAQFATMAREGPPGGAGIAVPSGATVAVPPSFDKSAGVSTREVGVSAPTPPDPSRPEPIVTVESGPEPAPQVTPSPQPGGVVADQPPEGSTDQPHEHEPGEQPR